jgi:2-aminoadipate transaminase
MFLWLQLPAPLDASELLPDALARGVAYVPGAPFHAAGGAAGTLRLSFVTASAAQIEAGIAALGALLAEQLEPVR